MPEIALLARPDFVLPPELLREVLTCMEPTDHRNMTLVSRFVREQALDFVFNHLAYTGLSISNKIRGIKQARDDVKASIRKLKLDSKNLAIREHDKSSVVLDFLRTLPSLQVLEYYQLGQLIPPGELSQLVDSVRSAPLSEFRLNTGVYAPVESSPTEGIAGLKKLSIEWTIGDSPNEPGSSLDHLYHLIRPSLNTLVELKIENSPEEVGPDLDLRLLSNAGETLRVFDYTMQHHDETILDTIPEIFPQLEKLTLAWSNMPDDHSLLWKDSHIKSLMKNKNLTELQLSSDFEEEPEDTVRADEDYAWYIRCYKRRLTATQKISELMPRLRKCNWLQMGTDHRGSTMLHSFVIEERAPNHEGEEPVRVVRGVKQRWMGGDREDWRNGEIVKCKLEDLPGDIIGENDPQEEEE